MHLFQLITHVQFYEIGFKATKPGILSTISLDTSVRQVKTYDLKVENPLPAQVVFSVSCSNSDVNTPNSIAVPAQSEVICI